MDIAVDENSYWWSINLTNNSWSCSTLLLQICGFNTVDTPLSDFLLLIHPEHLNKVQESIASTSITHHTDATYQLLTKFGYRWVCSKTDHTKQNIEGDTIVFFSLEFLTQHEVTLHEDRQTQLQLIELIGRYTSISDSLLELLHVPDRSEVILKTLNNLLEEFKGDRAYIFTYDVQHQTQSCTYEVVRDTIQSTKNDLQNIPLTDTKWWTEILYRRNQSIIYNSITDIPIDAKEEYELLKEQNIESIMVVPLITKSGAGGYIGIDMVGHQHIWTETDRLWFHNLANIISLCIELRKSEEAALIEREHYSQLYENMPIGFLRLQVIFDQRGHPINYVHQEINSMANHVVGTTGEDIASRLGEVLSRDGISEPLLLFERLINTREVHSVFAVQNKDSYHDYIFYSVEGEDVVVLIRDNTESVVVSRALAKSEQMLQNIYKNIPVGIEVYDKNGILIRINDMEQEIFGFESTKSVLGVNLFENPNVPSSFLEDLRNQKPSWCDFFYDFDRLNSYYSSSCKERKHIVLKGTILYDTDHNIESYLLIVIDNTDSLSANHKIREFEILFNSIAEFSEVGLCQWNRSENTIFGTDQWYQNLSQQNRIISNIMDAYSYAHEQDKANLERLFQEIISGEITSFREEVRIKDADGYRWLNTLYKVSEHNSDSFEIIGINIDITALKNTELMLLEAKHKAEESDRLKSAFLANMSHEIRTPLNAIVGFSNLLFDTEDQEQRQQYMSIIHQNNDLLLQLVTDILDISKIESGIIDIKSEAIDIDEMCGEIVYSHRMKVTDDHLDIRFETTGRGCIVDTDKNRLMQIISNLVGNAVKFTPKGSITLGYSLASQEVKFYVKDTGIGISAAHLQTIFNRFTKLNSFSNGTGLGLSICKSLIEKMGGTIWAESTVGIGSCFYFTVPYTHLQTHQSSTTIKMSSQLEEVATRKRSAKSEITILVVEDTDSNYLFISSLLKREYRILRAVNGIEAIEMFKLHSPSLILMDVKMPEMDGLEATKRIKALDANIPIIMLTAFAFYEDKIRAFEVGCCDFLTKPIHPTLLKDTIKKYIRTNPYNLYDTL